MALISVWSNIYTLTISESSEASSKGVKNLNKYVRDTYKPPFGSANVPDEAYTDGAITSRANLMLQDLSQNQTAPFFLAKDSNIGLSSFHAVKSPICFKYMRECGHPTTLFIH